MQEPAPLCTQQASGSRMQGRACSVVLQGVLVNTAKQVQRALLKSCRDVAVVRKPGA
ncbi:MAG TPA: hypothetical protein VN496_00365 [Burkholderiales bacterium]|nr:hypothetical protein [Burkholderiales bacterium]